MNERIKELAEQAGLRFTQLMSNPMVPVVDGKETDLKKFAELIIQECFKIVDDYGIEQAGIAEENYCGEQLYVSMKITDSAYKIKEYFGVGK